MDTKYKAIAGKLWWVFFSIVTTITLILAVFAWTFINKTFGFRFIEIFNSVASSGVGASIILFLFFLIFYFWEWRLQFSRMNANIIIIICGLTLTFIMLRTGKRSPGGWTSYPPMHPALSSKITTYTNAGANLLTTFEISIVICLLFITFRWRKKKKDLQQ